MRPEWSDGLFKRGTTPQFQTVGLEDSYLVAVRKASCGMRMVGANQGADAIQSGQGEPPEDWAPREAFHLLPTFDDLTPREVTGSQSLLGDLNLRDNLVSINPQA